MKTIITKIFGFLLIGICLGGARQLVSHGGGGGGGGSFGGSGAYGSREYYEYSLWEAAASQPAAGALVATTLGEAAAQPSLQETVAEQVSRD